MDEHERIAKGKALRRRVLGSAYVDAPGEAPTKFQAAFRTFAEEHCWANVWIRPGLELRERSMINLAILASLARWPEFEVHVHGALNNGVTEDEIVEIILQAGVYAGIPIASEAFRAADRAVARYKKDDEPLGGDSACWLHLVCPGCGAVLDRDSAEHRPGCLEGPSR